MRKLLLFVLFFLGVVAPAGAQTICPGVPFTFITGTTISSSQVNANFSSLVSCVNANAANSGANSNITSLSGLTTPLSLAQGGTGTTNGNFALATLGSHAVASPTLQQQFAPWIIFNSAYGADPTYTNSNNAAFLLFWQDCMANGGHFCVVPRGHYKFTASLSLDLHLNQAGGFTLMGGGGADNGTQFDFSGTSGAFLTIASSVAEGTFYGRMQGIGILANNTTGPAFQLGQYDLSDALNGFIFENIWVKNLAAASTSQGTRINYVLASVFNQLTTSDGCADAYGNCPTAGAGLQLRQAAFNTFNAGSFSAAGIALHMTDFGSFGNTFNSPDLEVAYNDWVIDTTSGQSAFNTIHNGQFQFCGAGGPFTCASGTGNMVVQNTDATHQSSNIVDNPNIGSPGVVIGGSSCCGFLFRMPRDLFGTPDYPVASGTLVRNTFGKTAMAILSGGDVYQVCYGPTGTACTTLADNTITIPVNLGDSIAPKWDGCSPGPTCVGGGWTWLFLP